MQFRINAAPVTCNTLLTLFSLVALLLLNACGGGGGGGGGGAGGGAASSGGSNIGQIGTSSNNSTRSHNAGTDCSDCHYSGGTGQGSFTIAGTVYTNGAGSAVAPNGIVKVYADQNRNTLVATVEVDAYGNFYTVNPIAGLTDTGGGIAGAYVTVGSNPMPGSVSTYANGCNTCHGPATATTFGGQTRIH